MAENPCSRCKQICVLKARPKENETFGAACDSCKEWVCRKCANINTTEAHAVALTHRVILFFCKSCKIKLEKLTNVLQQYKTELSNKESYLEVLNAEHREEISELKAEVIKLLRDNKEKETHITRLNRRTQDFTDIAEDVEKSYQTQIESHKQEIASLNKENLTILKKNEALSNEIKILQENISKAHKKLNELIQLKANMLTSIETLTAENELYIKDLKRSKIELFDLQEKFNELGQRKQEISVKTDNPTSSHIAGKNQDDSDQGKKDKILILGDEKVKYLHKHLNGLETKYDILTISKPGATYANIFKNTESLLKRYTLNDYVIVMGGTNDFIQKKTPNISKTFGSFIWGFETNFIFSSTPPIKSKGATKYINKFNNHLCSFLNRINRVSQGVISYIDCILDLGPKVTFQEIAKQIILEINSRYFRIASKPLIYVKCKNNVGSSLAEINLSNSTDFNVITIDNNHVTTSDELDILSTSNFDLDLSKVNDDAFLDLTVPE